MPHTAIDHPSLLIYIPTYNRYQFLERQLDNLVEQLSPWRGRLRILVSNNSSQDGDYGRLSSKYVNEPIEFRENPGNIGGNANITLGFVFAKKNEFLWILSDDDMIAPFALREIFSVISDAVDIIHIGEYLKTEFKKVRLNSVFTLPRGAGFGMISAAVFNMLFIRRSIESGFDYLDSSFPHLAILMAALNIRESAEMACVSHDMVFTSEILVTHGSADYAVSSVGFGYLGDFFSDRERKVFIRCWLKSNWRGFLDAKYKNRIRYQKAIGYLAIKSPALFVLLILSKVPMLFRALIKKILR